MRNENGLDFTTLKNFSPALEEKNTRELKDGELNPHKAGDSRPVVDNELPTDDQQEPEIKSRLDTVRRLFGLGGANNVGHD